MRRFLVSILLLLVVAVPAAAFVPRDSYLNTVAAVAWLDGEELNVAVGNSSNTRTVVTISTTTRDMRGRPVFASRQVQVPGRTIVLEKFYPAALGRGEEWNLRISEGYRFVSIPVQTRDIFGPESYVVAANTQWTTTVNLDQLLDASGRTRIVVDDYYQTADGYHQDRIRIDSLGGGPTQVRGSNTIEYVQPYLVLKMKTPNIPGMTTMSFGLRKVDSMFSWRDELVDGPVVLVYGRNMRYAGETSSTSPGSGRIAR